MIKEVLALKKKKKISAVPNLILRVKKADTGQQLCRCHEQVTVLI